MRMQQSIVTVSEGMLEVNRSTLGVNRSMLKVYKVLVWLTVVLAVGTLGQVVIAVYSRCADQRAAQLGATPVPHPNDGGR